MIVMVGDIENSTAEETELKQDTTTYIKTKIQTMTTFHYSLNNIFCFQLPSYINRFHKEIE